MPAGRTKNLSKKSPDLLQNPELTAAQMTLSRTVASKPAPATPFVDASDVLEQAGQLWNQNDNIQSINMLKGLLEHMKDTRSSEVGHKVITHVNLAVSYYKIGFLEEAIDQFQAAIQITQQLSLSLKASSRKEAELPIKVSKLRCGFLTNRIQLQMCILSSESGKHDSALLHAQAACKKAYNNLIDLQMLQYQQVAAFKARLKNLYSPDDDADELDELLNNIAVVEQLISCTWDLASEFVAQEKLQAVQEEKLSFTRESGPLPKANIDKLFELSHNLSSIWVYKNKILDEIQMKFLDPQYFKPSILSRNDQAIQKIVYLTISLYCYSTETRFMEKDKQLKDPSEVLDSEHWLSRSLQIAYVFLPHDAPILSQIVTVHDRFHGIDKQTIPEDRQLGGFFKVLRPLSKPKSSYSSKTSVCLPIMIRIQMPKVSFQIKNQKSLNDTVRDESSRPKKAQFINKTIDIQLHSRNNTIRGLTDHKKYDLNLVSNHPTRRNSNTKTDFTEDLNSIYMNGKINSLTKRKATGFRIDLQPETKQEQKEGQRSKHRPHSHERQISLHNEVTEIQTQRKKRHSFANKQITKKRSATTHSTKFKLDELQISPNSFRKIDDDNLLQFSNVSAKIEQEGSSKTGGNIFISNNINLFISKQVINNANQGSQCQEKLPTRRHLIKNKRRSHNSNLSNFVGLRSSELAF